MKKAICMILIGILALGAIAVPAHLGHAANGSAASQESGSQQVSDYFYVHIYDSQDVVVSKYQILLTGVVSDTGREITSVSFSHISGDSCVTGYVLDGYTAIAVVTHPTEGYVEYNFMLSESGEFTGY